MNAGLKFALIVSLACHVVCFRGVDFTFGKKLDAQSLKAFKIFFLGSILGGEDSLQSESDSPVGMDKLTQRLFLNMLQVQPLPGYEFTSQKQAPEKLSLMKLTQEKISYYKPCAPAQRKEIEPSVMFYPSMPYHFLLYFKDRQTAYMEVDYYISAHGKVMGIKRRVSSGNPEVDLLIMRNLVQFLELYKSNLVLDSWQTVKIDLSH